MNSNLLFIQTFFPVLWMIINCLLSSNPTFHFLTILFSFLEVKFMQNPEMPCATQAKPIGHSVPLAIMTGSKLSMRPDPVHSKCSSWSYLGMWGKKDSLSFIKINNGEPVKVFWKPFRLTKRLNLSINQSNWELKSNNERKEKDRTRKKLDSMLNN